jgi:hypothetical protein
MNLSVIKFLNPNLLTIGINMCLGYNIIIFSFTILKYGLKSGPALQP